LTSFREFLIVTALVFAILCSLAYLGVWEPA
jgi:cytochrome oxidase assembly protein ShyY1